VNAQYKGQRRKKVLDKLNPKLSSLASEPFSDAGKTCLVHPFEEKVRKTSETVKTLPEAGPRKSNKQFFWRETSS